MPGDPHSGSKVWEAPDREIGKPGENRGEVIAHRDVQPTAGFYNRENRRDLGPRLWTADVQPILSNNWFVIADALRQAGLDLSRVVKSKHSVDILAKDVNKSHLLAHVVQQFKIDPYEILTVGDQGAWPGNDSSLLEHRFSLSVDIPSRRLDRGWKLAPAHKRDVDATIWYLDRLRLEGHGRFKMFFTESPEDHAK